MPEHVGYIPFLRANRKDMGLSEDELERLLTLFADYEIASYFRSCRSYGDALVKAGMARERFNTLWRRGPITTLLRGERPTAQINEIADVLEELRRSP